MVFKFLILHEAMHTETVEYMFNSRTPVLTISLFGSNFLKKTIAFGKQPMQL